jgi:capsular exopolysaccharide synthesis family protein
MGKIQETLQRVKKEYEDRIPRLLEKLEKRKDGATLPACLPAVVQGTECYLDCYEDLKINLLSYHHDKSIKTILFLGTTHGDGASTTAINFATTLARDGQLNVLLIEANLRNPSLHEVFHVDPDQNRSGFPTDGNKANGGFKKVGPENLYVVTPGSKLSGPLSLFESQRFWEFLKTMRTEFDYVILDGPPLPSFSESKVICNKVDGVVMVVESGKTRKQVALRAKKEIEQAGGTVLGVVLNKRKYHMPKWIYKHL